MATVNRQQDPEDIEEWIEIDEMALDKEWVSQAPRYYKLAIKLAKAKQAHVEAKSVLDLCEAMMADKIRMNPQRFGLEKITDASLKIAIKKTKEYQTAETSMNEIRYEVDKLQAAIEAMDHRKKALENLVHLHGMSYFADPVDRSENKEATEHYKRNAAYAKTKIKLKR